MTMPTVPVLYLVAAIVGVLFTINGFRPAHRPSLFTVPSFFAGWLTSELPIHHIVWQAIARFTSMICAGNGARGASR